MRSSVGGTPCASPPLPFPPLAPGGPVCLTPWSPSRLHLPVVNRTGWFIGADDGPEVRGGEGDRTHRRGTDALVEQAATGAEHHRKGHEAEAVDELVLQ